MTRSAGDRVSVALDEQEEWLVASRRRQDSLAVVVSASLSGAIAAITTSATGTVTVSVSLSAAPADLPLSAAGAVIDKASLAATLDPITVDATGSLVAIVVPPARRSGGPWWWPAYARRHEAEREAARLQWLVDHTIEGDAYGELPAPIGRGTAFHDPDAMDAEAIAAAASLLWLRAA
jgi:hypothetical protein